MYAAYRYFSACLVPATPSHSQSIGFILCVVLIAPLSAGGSSVHSLESLPSITAVHVSMPANTETVVSKSRVQFSPDGMRVLESHAGSKLEIVQNFVTNQVWFVDKQRSIVHELALLQRESVDKTLDDISLAEGEPQPGLLSAEPCIDLEPLQIGLSTWRGQSVSVWHCLDHSEQLYAKQYFSLAWNIVIREQRNNGIVDELRNIETANFSVDHFFPSKKFRATDLRELLLGSRGISRYSGD